MPRIRSPAWALEIGQTTTGCDPPSNVIVGIKQTVSLNYIHVLRAIRFNELLTGGSISYLNIVSSALSA